MLTINDIADASRHHVVNSLFPMPTGGVRVLAVLKSCR